MTILTELHQDHINLNKLLVLLRTKVATMKQGQDPNFSLIGDVIHYICSYADGFHHPREDRLYAFFSGRNADLNALLARCEQEHAALKTTSLQLKEAIEGVLHDAVMPMADFAALLDSFVTQQTAHLNFEEGDIFPRLDAVATQTDWDTLAEQLPKPEDPLFGEKQAYEFSDLYKELIIDLNAA